MSRVINKFSKAAEYKIQLNIYQTENRDSNRYLYTHVHSSIITVKREKQHKCPSTEERLKKKKYIDTMEYYYLALKKNEGNSLVVQWLGLCVFTAKGTGSIPVLGTKILQATWYSKKKNFFFPQKKERQC